MSPTFHNINMPFESQYPSLPIPDVDLWGFLFERKDKPFSDDKGAYDCVSF
jgi:4-coumarate--CoA ligase